MARRVSRAKKKKISIIIAGVLIVGIAFAAAYMLSVNQIKAQYEAVTLNLQSQIDSVRYMAYVANTDIPAGTAITEQNVTPTVISTSMSPSFYITEEDIGKIAVVDIRTGEAVCTNMIGNDLLSTLRECEFAMIVLNANLVQNDFVDVRIMYTNGENYSVLPKKGVKGINYETNEVYFWLDEEDIMLISSAIVDVYMNPGSILYTTKYIEDGQEAIVANYQPSADVMAAMANDPNLVATATARLNASMRNSIEERLSVLNEGSKSPVDLTDVITSGGADPGATDNATTDENNPEPGNEISNGDASDSSTNNNPSGWSDSNSVSNENNTTDPGDINSSYVDPSADAYEDENNAMNNDGGETYVY